MKAIDFNSEQFKRGRSLQIDLIKKHVSHPVCMTLEGSREHVRCMPEMDLMQWNILLNVFGAKSVDDLAGIIWRTAIETKNGKLLN